MSKLYVSFIAATITFLCGCAVNPEGNYEVKDSYLKQDLQVSSVASDELHTEDKTIAGGFTSIPALSMHETIQSDTVDLASGFSDTQQVEITADELPLTDFLHYVMGEVLGVNYILGDSAKKANQTVTLNIQQNISKQKLFLLTQELLAEKGFLIRLSEDIFYINNEESAQGKAGVAFGYGQSSDSVPQTSTDIIQIVPFKFGMRGNLSLTLPSIASVQVTPDNQQGTVLLKGKRVDIIKALDFIRIIDTPAYRNQAVAAFKTTFVPVKTLVTKLDELLRNDGYSGGLSTVTLDAQSTLVLFSADNELMQRARFWLQQLDVPADTDEKQYFVFQPLYARASDLTESLAPLLGSVQGSSPSTKPNPNNSAGSNSSSEKNSRSSVLSAGNEDISIVVDARSNNLIISASGKDYRGLLPLIERMDVPPKQVMLEVMIVEVTLTDQFERGVEFFLEENNFTLGNQGTFGLAGIGGLSYILTGSNRWDVDAKLKQGNDLVNIISRPSLVVRDGVTASLEVGTEIPIASTTSGPDQPTTTSVQYRKTGLSLRVTPTVNSRGVVIMEIDQQITNSLDGGVTVGDAPSISTRNLTTEVVANSGQTVILGGIISENKTNSQSNVPGLSDIPILGHLFTVKSDEKIKTELVIMVTPRIIESAQQWDDIKASMSEQLQQIDISNGNAREEIQVIKSSKN
ncbi:MAG: general secretion pathway protein D [Paraglaciecola sp.]|jgi:general secretion pathway protein D